LEGLNVMFVNIITIYIIVHIAVNPIMFYLLNF
jgi:hypothetical protein